MNNIGTGPIRAFLNYSDNDLEIAKKIKLELRAFGIEIFVAESDLKDGAEWMDFIVREISKHTIFLVLLSENYRMANYASQEFGICFRHAEKVIPIRIDDVKPYGFMSKYHGRLYDKSIKRDEMAKIVEEIISHHARTSDLFEFFTYRYVNAVNFADADFYTKKLEKYNLDDRLGNHDLIKKYINEIVDAITTNSQINVAPSFLRQYAVLINRDKMSNEKIQTIL